MNAFRRIQKITEANDHIDHIDHIDQAVSLILAAVYGLEIEERVKHDIVCWLTQLIIIKK